MSKLFDLDEFVQKAIHHRASDIHFQTGDEPQFRIDGAIRQINLPKVSSQQIEDLKSLLLDDRSSRQLDEHIMLHMRFIHRINTHIFALLLNQIIVHNNIWPQNT